MKLFQKKKDNKGFSLVELIVVVAIMAVLLGVLVPTLVRHVETSKHQKDISAISEIREAIEIALANEKYATLEGTIVFTGAEVTIDESTQLNGVTSSDISDFMKEVISNINGGERDDEGGLSFTYTYKSKIASDDTTTTFNIANEKVKATVASTRYGTGDNAEKVE